jgi:hypothetical protein
VNWYPSLLGSVIPLRINDFKKGFFIKSHEMHEHEFKKTDPGVEAVGGKRVINSRKILFLLMRREILLRYSKSKK